MAKPCRVCGSRTRWRLPTGVDWFCIRCAAPVSNIGEIVTSDGDEADLVDPLRVFDKPRLKAKPHVRYRHIEHDGQAKQWDDPG